MPLSHSRIDLLGATLSFACAVHCFFLFILFGALPLFDLGFLLDRFVDKLFMSSAGIVEMFFVMSNIERILLAAAVPLGTLSLAWGVKKHKRWSVFLFLSAGAGTIAAGRWLVVPGYQSVVVVLGALFIAAAHLTNRRFCQACLDRRTLGSFI